MGALLVLLGVIVAVVRSRALRGRDQQGQFGGPGAKPQLEDAATRAQRQAQEVAAARARALRDGLSRTRGGFIARIGDLLSRKRIDAGVLDQLEEILFTADIGVKTSQHLFERVRADLSRADLQDAGAVLGALKEESRRLLEVPAAPVDWASKHPFVLLVVGVNGVGKTTTIGKLAAQHVAAGRKVMLAAGDTFRAAAAEQLDIWAARSGAEIVQQASGADPGAVVFDAVRSAQARGVDVLIADTAGRLHGQTHLMDELKKIRRVIQRVDAAAPDEVLLVLDANQGQNALAQAREFHAAVGVTGLVLTKLDGTARGGVVVAIARAMQLPIRFIGIGEQAGDFGEFSAEAFVDALLGTGPTLASGGVK